MKNLQQDPIIAMLYPYVTEGPFKTFRHQSSGAIATYAPPVVTSMADVTVYGKMWHN